jgi:ABC-type sugar transport system ATPase subunit
MSELMTKPSAVAAPAPMLATRAITKTFGSVQALQAVDFDVRAGEATTARGNRP